jgi:hypothetical protein
MVTRLETERPERVYGFDSRPLLITTQRQFWYSQDTFTLHLTFTRLYGSAISIAFW